MKKAIIFGIFLVFFFTQEGYGQKKHNQITVQKDTIAADSIKYELIVFDPGFDSWLVTQPSVNFYSQNYYEMKNRLYVWEWNYRYDHPIRFGALYDMRIDYDSSIDYGLDLNYRLYNYFRFFEATNKIRLIDQSR